MPVLTIPAQADYISSALPSEHLLPTPMTAREARGWDPSPAWSPSWIAQHRSDIDVVHVHFGFEWMTLPQLRSWCQTLAALELPLVVTVHDLHNPHVVDQQAYAAQLDLLLAYADQVITLTPGAARALERRTAKPVEVIAHPPLFAGRSDSRRTRTVTRIGIFAKDRAQNQHVAAVVAGVLRGTQRSSVASSLTVWAGKQQHERLVGSIDVDAELRLLEPLTATELAATLGGLDVCVLPYAFGTHSGWLEACRDLGTHVVAPDCGFYREQWSEVREYAYLSTGPDQESLAGEVAAACLTPAPTVDPDEGRLRAERSISGHRAIYRQLGSTPHRLAA